MFTKEQKKEYQRLWLDKNREHIKEYKLKNKIHIREVANRRHHTMRQEILERLGDKCARCNESDFRCLQIDHIHGGGQRENEKYHSSLGFFYKLAKLSDEELKLNYQLLCANCNWKKRYDNNEVPNTFKRI